MMSQEREREKSERRRRMTVLRRMGKEKRV